MTTGCYAQPAGAENVRRTMVVHTKLAGHMARVEAARSGALGVQVLTMGQMATRLAGGFIAPIDTGTLQDAVRDALPETHVGELENIKNLPGMVRAVVGTLEKVWQAGIELSSHSQPRLRALAALEQNVLDRLPPYMKKPKDLWPWPARASLTQSGPLGGGSLGYHSHSIRHHLKVPGTIE